MYLVCMHGDNLLNTNINKQYEPPFWNIYQLVLLKFSIFSMLQNCVPTCNNTVKSCQGRAGDFDSWGRKKYGVFGAQATTAAFGTGEEICLQFPF